MQTLPTIPISNRYFYTLKVTYDPSLPKLSRWNFTTSICIKSKDLHGRKREPSQGFSPGASETVKHSVRIHCLSSPLPPPQLLEDSKKKSGENVNENETRVLLCERSRTLAEGSRRCSPRSVLTAKWIKSLLPSRAGAYYSLVEATTHPPPLSTFVVPPRPLFPSPPPPPLLLFSFFRVVHIYIYILRGNLPRPPASLRNSSLYRSRLGNRTRF